MGTDPTDPLTVKKAQPCGWAFSYGVTESVSYCRLTVTVWLVRAIAFAAAGFTVAATVRVVLPVVGALFAGAV
jgi:hypothetical protein